MEPFFHHQHHPPPPPRLVIKWGNPSSSTKCFRTIDLPSLPLSHGLVQSLLPSLFLSLSEGRLRFLSRCCCCCRPLLLHHLIIFSSCVYMCVWVCMCMCVCVPSIGWLAGWLAGWRAGLGNTWSRSMRRGFISVAYRPLLFWNENFNIDLKRTMMLVPKRCTVPVQN